MEENSASVGSRAMMFGVAHGMVERDERTGENVDWVEERSAEGLRM